MSESGKIDVTIVGGEGVITSHLILPSICHLQPVFLMV